MIKAKLTVSGRFLDVEGRPNFTALLDVEVPVVCHGLLIRVPIPIDDKPEEDRGMPRGGRWLFRVDVQVRPGSREVELVTDVGLEGEDAPVLLTRSGFALIVGANTVPVDPQLFGRGVTPNKEE